LCELQKWKLLVTTTVHYDEATHDPMDNNQILLAVGLYLQILYEGNNRRILAGAEMHGTSSWTA
jgi:hypothetical protein